VHPVTGCGDFNDISRFGSTGVWSPNPILAVVTFSVLASLCLWMFWIFQCMIAIRNAHTINIERKTPAFSEVENAFV
jgi:hypothetical protein